MSTTTAPLSPWSAVRLVASREIKQRAGSKAFLWTTVVLVVLIVGGAFLAQTLRGGESTLAVGVTQETAALAESVTETASGFGTTAEVTTVTEEEGRTQVLDGDLDAVVLSAEGGTVKVITKSTLDTDLSSVLTVIAQQTVLAEQVTSLGGDPSDVSRAVAQASVDVEAIEPPREIDPSQIISAYLVGILMFISLQLCGAMIAQGVVEEKSSRVVELLLATVRPWQLMAGKVLGIGVIGLGQVVVLVAAAAGSAAGFGLLDGMDLNLGATVLWTIAWFLIGFTMYALLFAAAAALVSRQEDVGTVTTPILMLMMIPYIVSVSVAPFAPDSPVVVWLSYLPFTSPLIMPTRVAVGGVEMWQVAVVMAVNIALVPLLVWLAGRIYSNAVLRSGARIKLKDALRAA
ncbi:MULTISPECIES: ABC transporter permease [Sanguibacter]|jgi:ABC-2 type transport system permease protein|uniref:ABC transporter permease n=1 Tax=Sanguibacter inulinus TaxID=60922 RepID=A0A853ENX1_9MICO|nr:MULTISPECIES: ABC transporter permease [Sanguibacter]KQT99896.1 sodium ABC transporter permease [Sanguibacter sp. Leaf3]MBF0721095.1 ABC transporter permease [Sanguibacter inulinus]NYS92240.1 ABC transporter permease [Sanguibacter inulinus]